MPITKPRRARPALEALEDRLVPSTITGLLFDDHNGDGVRQSAEAPLAGRTVFLDDDRDGYFEAGERSAVTAADGSFRFDNLAPGRYLVAQLSPPGWRATAPLVAAALDAVPDAGALIGLNRLHADPRFDDVDGRGFSVAVIDSGLASHPFFPAGTVAAQYDFVNNDDVAEDGFGHGTHVASVIASRDTTYPGIAPGVRVIPLKVLDGYGNGDFDGIERALQWVIDHGAEYNVVAVNLSFGDGGNYDSARSLNGIGDELDQLAKMGITLVAAAGNGYGPGDSPGLTYPAIDPNVLAVGAVWDANQGGPWGWQGGVRDYTTGADRIVSFSQRLPGAGELFAPGTQITGAAPDGGTTEMSGTSTAAAVVSGAVALAQQLAHDRLGRLLTPAELRDLMQQTGDVIRDGDDENDNVPHTNAAFRRLDVMALAEAILAKGTVSRGPTASSRDVSMGADQTVDVGSMGSFHDGTVGGVLFVDANGDGQRNPGEAAVTGRFVFADRDGDGRRDPGEVGAWTDSQGRFVLSGLTPGTVQVRQDLPAGQVQTTALVSLTVTSGLSRNDLAIGSRPQRVNSSPTLSGDGLTTTIDEDDRPLGGVTVGSMLDGTFADTDASAQRGLAVVETFGTAWGRWQYTLDDGRSWSDVGAVSLTRALMLRAQDRLRFIPGPDANGTASVRYYAWDRTTGTWGLRADLTSARGGGGAFSMASALSRVVVRPLNDAPVLTAAGKFTPVTIGSVPPGDLVSAFSGGTVRDPDEGASVGIVIVGATGQGTWQFSRDGGSTWQNLGVVSAAKARLLAPTDRIRFVPSGTQRSAPTLTYRGWDMTSGVADDVIDLSLAAFRGTTAFSRYQMTSALLVTSSSSAARRRGWAR